MSEKVLPHPVICDGNGKLTKNYSTREWFIKIAEELLEAQAADTESIVRDDFSNNNLAEELADVITVCISMLNAIGYDEEQRSGLFAAVNTKNEKRGYFIE